MSATPITVYDFEGALESAVCAYLTANGINDPKKQRGNDLLMTPRVEVKFQFGGFPTKHEHVVSTTLRYFDIGHGTLYLKIVTRRDDADQNHSALRSMCRWLMQPSCRQPITDKMEFHLLEDITETASTITFAADENHDVSALAFEVRVRVVAASFPST